MPTPNINGGHDKFIYLVYLYVTELSNQKESFPEFKRTKTKDGETMYLDIGLILCHQMAPHWVSSKRAPLVFIFVVL